MPSCPCLSPSRARWITSSLAPSSFSYDAATSASPAGTGRGQGGRGQGKPVLSFYLHAPCLQPPTYSVRVQHYKQQHRGGWREMLEAIPPWLGLAWFGPALDYSLECLIHFCGGVSSTTYIFICPASARFCPGLPYLYTNCF